MGFPKTRRVHQLEIQLKMLKLRVPEIIFTQLFHHFGCVPNIAAKNEKKKKNSNKWQFKVVIITEYNICKALYFES